MEVESTRGRCNENPFPGALLIDVVSSECRLFLTVFQPVVLFT